MPSLPLTPDTAIAAGDLAIATTDDLKALLPKKIAEPDAADVRDALLEALLAICLTYQNEATYASAQSDIGQATDQFLDGLAEDRQSHRQPDESNDTLRGRVVSVPSQVTPQAVTMAVNGVLSEFDKECQLFDSVLDRWYATDGTAVYHSFVGETPEYLDRLYPADESVNGDSVPNSEPGGAWVFDDHVGRKFVLRVPDLTQLDLTRSFVYTAALISDNTQRKFIGDDSLTPSDAGFSASVIATDQGSASAVYNSLSDTVQAIVGHGIRWDIVPDSAL